MVLQLVNAAGLIFDIAGASLIFKYGLIGEITRVRIATVPRTKKDDTPEAIKKDKMYMRLPKVGMYMLIGGFFLQFVSSLIQALTE